MVALPQSLASFFTLFPLHTYPPIKPLSTKPASSPTGPTLWISPPLASSSGSASSSTSDSASSPAGSDVGSTLLSGDVECLKWQAYIALRGLTNVKVRWDILPEGALDARLPNLHLPKSDAEKLNNAFNLTEDKEKKEVKHSKGAKSDVADGQLHLYSAPVIPSWVDLTLGVDSASDVLEGYKDTAARDESRAWVSLLEGAVHAALLISQPQRSTLSQLLDLGTTSAPSPSKAPSSNIIQIVLSPPPAPLTGFTSLLPSFGTRVNPASILSQYRDAIASLSERLGTDKWFLGSSEPTPLDALAYAYLHCILSNSKDPIRIEVTKRINLVAWEWRVRESVRAAFIH